MCNSMHMACSGQDRWVWLWWPTKECYLWCWWTMLKNSMHTEALFLGLSWLLSQLVAQISPTRDFRGGQQTYKPITLSLAHARWVITSSNQAILALAFSTIYTVYDYYLQLFRTFDAEFLFKHFSSWISLSTSALQHPSNPPTKLSIK